MAISFLVGCLGLGNALVSMETYSFTWILAIATGLYISAAHLILSGTVQRWVRYVSIETQWMAYHAHVENQRRLAAMRNKK